MTVTDYTVFLRSRWYDCSMNVVYGGIYLHLMLNKIILLSIISIELTSRPFVDNFLRIF